MEVYLFYDILDPNSYAHINLLFSSKSLNLDSLTINFLYYLYY